MGYRACSRAPARATTDGADEEGDLNLLVTHEQFMLIWSGFYVGAPHRSALERA